MHPLSTPVERREFGRVLAKAFRETPAETKSGDVREIRLVFVWLNTPKGEYPGAALMEKLREQIKSCPHSTAPSVKS